MHKPGDLLILSDFSNGGGTSTINIYKWTGADATGALTFLAGGDRTPSAAAPPTTLLRHRQPGQRHYVAVVLHRQERQPHFLNGEFYEGGVNLSDPSINLGGECFSSFAAETRSSTSTTATLKDFVLGQFALCSASMTTTPSADETAAGAVSPGTPVTDTAIVSFKGSTVLPTGNVTFYLCGPIATRQLRRAGRHPGRFAGSARRSLPAGGGTGAGSVVRGQHGRKPAPTRTDTASGELTRVTRTTPRPD